MLKSSLGPPWPLNHIPPWSLRSLHIRRPLPSRPFSRLSLLQHTQRRGLKRKTSIRLADLTQGVLETTPPALTPEDLSEDEPTYPRTLQQHLNNVKKFTGCVVLTRVGNFYEMYGEQAEKYGPLLNLKVASRKTSLGSVPMSGFQIFQLDRYLKILVQDLNMPVAIAEEVRNSASDQVKHGGLLYDRKVSRVITAGTLIDEAFMDPFENNFLLSVYSRDQLTTQSRLELHHRLPANDATSRQDISIGLSWVDLSSGDFFLQQTSPSHLSSMVARIAPKEVLLDSSLEDIDRAELKNVLGDGHYTLTHHDDSGAFARVDKWERALDEPLDTRAQGFSSEEIAAASLLLDYVQSKLRDVQVTLRPPIRWTDKETMVIDKHSLRGLEIRATLRDDGFAGSLLHAVRRTVTTSGARALGRRLGSPSMDLVTINERLDLVQLLLEHQVLNETVAASLGRTFDVPRLIQKFSSGRGDADDLLSIQKTVLIMSQLFELIKDHADHNSTEQHIFLIRRELDKIDFNRLLRLSNLIDESIDEDALSRQRTAEQDQKDAIVEFAETATEKEESGQKARKPSRKDNKDSDVIDTEIWIMKRGASTLLSRAHQDLTEAYGAKLVLRDSLRQTFGHNSLTLRWTPQHGNFCHVKTKTIKSSMVGLREISSTKTTRTFAIPQWTELGHRIDHIKTRIRGEEQRVFAALRDEVITNLVKLRRCANVLDELDIACSSATLARERDWVRPILNNGTSQNIVGGKHPTVDIGVEESGRSFVSNDCTMPDNERIMLITGPNMAGKSTYLRQNALIAILAQTGCYVPAEYAELGLVDKIFSRVGSADNLSKHQSTFMVEMNEVAEILNSATRRSFVVMDEVGRGTTPEDGIAVGYACLKYLHDKIGCRTLFATHFHDLADMTADMPQLSRWCTDVEEDSDGSWTYVHKLKRGVNRQSHALKVAKLAGMPDEAVNVAREVLQMLQMRRHQTI